jgi:dihydrofolate reductase
MRKLLVTSFLSLDGVMQAPGGPGEDESGGFAYGGWSVTFWDDAMAQAMSEIMGAPFDLVLGRRTYEIFASYWPNAPEEAGAKPLNVATKYVATRGRPALGWKESVRLEGDAADSVARLKEGDGPELQVHGSANLLQTLIRHDLVDVYHLWFFPVVIGSGKRLFADGAVPRSLRMTGSVISSTGVMIGTYVPAGALVTGSF